MQRRAAGLSQTNGPRLILDRYQIFKISFSNFLSENAMNGMKSIGWFFAGLFIGAILAGTLFYTNFRAKEGFVAPVSTSARVHQVLTDWSGSPTFVDTDQLTDLWNRTRDSGHHDYPFEQGGSDGLAKLLNNEFRRHTPKADFAITPQHFPPTGGLKTVAQLVTTYNDHVVAQ
jgi:hypothetical protein